jgi:hypothetical protein
VLGPAILVRAHTVVILGIITVIIDHSIIVMKGVRLDGKRLAN